MLWKTTQGEGSILCSRQLFLSREYYYWGIRITSNSALSIRRQSGSRKFSIPNNRPDSSTFGVGDMWQLSPPLDREFDSWLRRSPFIGNSLLGLDHVNRRPGLILRAFAIKVSSRIATNKISTQNSRNSFLNSFPVFAAGTS